MTPLETVFLTVAGLSGRGALLIALALIARFTLRRVVAPRFIFAGWLLVAGALLLPWRLPVPWHPLTSSPVSQRQSVPMENRDEDEFAVRPVTAAVPFMLTAPSGVISKPATSSAVAPARFNVFGQRVVMQRSWFTGLVVIWLAGIIALVSARVVALRRLTRALDRTRLPVDARLVAAVKAIAVELGLKKSPEIIVTPLVETPALCGVVRLRLLFPVGFETRVSATELPWVVRHELTHWQRRDTWAQLWLQVACSVHWFNPLVWLAARLAREDSELACDEAVLRRHADNSSARVAYGETLLSVIGGTRSAPRLPTVIGIVESHRQLMKRIMFIAAHRPPTLLRTLVGVALLTGVVGVGATEVMSTPAPERASVAMTSLPEAVKITAPAPMPKLSAEEQAKLAERRRADEKQWEDNMTFALEGIGRVGGVPVAFLSMNGNLSAVIERSQVARRMVETIDVDNKQVTLVRQGQPPLVLALTTSDPIALTELQDFVVNSILSKEGIKRLNEFRGVPSELALVWDELSRQGQAEVLNGYLLRGLVVGVHIRPGGGAGSSSGKLFEKEIAQRDKARRDAFFAALTPEQRARYSVSQQAIRFTASAAEREKASAAANAAKTSRAEVLAELTPAQRALYDEWWSWLMLPPGQT
ncbi:M56 family metallopeptidase [Oleiharenicola lentus]|uniref:M56 family metallopeptidase n=1 Tax=Oleiharenicola lentus TaxID=2508720 RepID=UPI003F67D777